VTVLAFDYPTWIARFPEFTNTPNVAVLAPLMFNEASLYVSNTDQSPIVDLTVRALILNLVTAHLMFLNYGIGAAGASQLVGRISNATEGSVTVATQYAEAKPGSRAWFDQTKYGAQAYAALGPYRRFRYIPGCSSRPFGNGWG
jgi:hypothetical protein